MISIRVFQHIARDVTSVLKGTPVVVRVNNETLVNKGQGDGETK